MSRTRWLARAVFASARLLTGLGSRADASIGPIVQSVSAAAGAHGSVTDGRLSLAAVTAVESGGVPVLARSEARRPLRLSITAIAVITLAAAAIGRRGRRFGRVVELAIRSQSRFLGPTPGRRAPPPALVI